MNTWTNVIVWILAWAAAGGLIIVALDALITSRKQRRLMAAGLYPKPGAGTDEDVQRLLAAGHQDMAIRCHRAIHRVSYQQAHDQLLVREKRAAYHGAPFIGMILGIGLGGAFKVMPLGMAMGLAVGLLVMGLMKKYHSTRPKS